MNRTYHRLTARDNGWFNANEKLKETVADMEKAHVDDYDEVLPIFIYGSEEQAKAMVPALEICIEKCGTVIERHAMEFGGKEANTWIDDAYFVMGKSHFYKRSFFDAERTFDYVGRRYKGQNRQLESKLWYARTAIRNEQYAKAQSTLDEVKNQKELPKKFPHDELSAIQADVNLKRGKVDDAIVDLERAVELADNREERVRWMFILAQLYMAKGMEEKAIAQFNKVARSHPPYELGFHARIFEALSFDRGNSAVLRKKLKRMLRDEKNKDHFDMIEYALADIDLKENKDSSAIAHLQRSARVSTTDTRQKAKSFLRLADIYFDDKQYPPAQQYYDSTSTLLAETHKRYEEVKTRAEVLGELVEQLDIINREDSLQAFAKLDKDEREKRIKKIIRDRERAEEEKAAEEAAARETTLNGAPKPGTDNKPQPGGANAWYFYNQTQLARGLAEFKKIWGNRANEDDWRRKDKAGSAFAVNTEDEEEGGEEGKEGKETEAAWKDPGSYLKDVPLDSAAVDASNARICTALYIAGTIYKEKLKDIDNAVESFEVLNNRFEECRYTPESFYQLYRIYLEKERKGLFAPDGFGSRNYADIIVERWPDSEFARLVRDPNQLLAEEEVKRREESDYAALYQRYRERDHIGVISVCNTVLETQPNNRLRPKYQLLKALSVGGMRDMGAFRLALMDVQTKFSGTDEAKAAADILAQLDKQANAPSGNPPPEVVASPEYTPADGPHFVCIVFPNADGDINPAKVKVSDFNMANFRDKTFQVGTSLLDMDNQVIKVSPFADKQKAMEYYSLFTADQDYLPGVNDKGYVVFAISAANYTTFYRNKDVDAYAVFFNEQYLQADQ